jgi:hypothetical protein
MDPTTDTPPAVATENGLTIENILEECKARIFLRDQIDGRWQACSLALLDEKAPLRGAYWRGVLTERFRLTGTLPVMVPADDVELRASRPGSDSPDRPDQGADDKHPDRLPGR